MALSLYAFFIVVVLGGIASVNSGETMSDFTAMMVGFSIFASLGITAYGLVLNRKSKDQEYGTLYSKD